MAKWVRDGTLVVNGGTQIDLRSRTENPRTRRFDWITVKGATDAASEAIAAQLLRELNAAGVKSRRTRMQIEIGNVERMPDYIPVDLTDTVTIRHRSGTRVEIDPAGNVKIWTDFESARIIPIASNVIEVRRTR